MGGLCRVYCSTQTNRAHLLSWGSARYTYYIYKGKKTDLNNDVTELKDVVILRHQVARRYGDHTPHNSTI